MKIILIILSFIALLFVYDQLHTVQRNNIQPIAPVDSGGKKADSGGIKRETANTPTTWTPRQLDSLFKYLNIYVEFMDVDSATRHRCREVVAQWYADGTYRLRDTAFVYRGEGCIKVVGRPGLTRGVQDTIIWRDTCQQHCLKAFTVPLGCPDTTWIEKDTTFSKRICDTVCYADFRKDTNFIFLTREEVEKLKHVQMTFFGVACDTSRNTFDTTRNDVICLNLK